MAHLFNTDCMRPELAWHQECGERAGQTLGGITAPAALLTGGRCRPQRPWGSSSLPPYQKTSPNLTWELPVPLPAPTALLPGGRCRPQRPWGSSSLPPYQNLTGAIWKPVLWGGPLCEQLRPKEAGAAAVIFAQHSRLALLSASACSATAPPQHLIRACPSVPTDLLATAPQRLQDYTEPFCRTGMGPLGPDRKRAPRDYE